MPQPPPPRLTILTGPTASGKTSLALALAQQWQGWGYEPNILCADSQQVVAGLAIGTAQPTAAELAQVPHWGHGWALPTQQVSVADYVAEVAPRLTKLLAQPHTPVLVVGGTGFYLQALFEPTCLPPVPPNPALRQRWATQAQGQPPGWLHQQLAHRDATRAAQLHPNDTMRLLRALELSEALAGAPIPTEAQPALFALNPKTDAAWALQPPNRAWLWQRIEQRVEAMLAQGWLAETEALLAQWGPTAHALNVAHGYPELMAVLQGRLTLEQAKQQITINVRQYARRQRIWLQRRPHYRPLAADIPLATLHNSLPNRSGLPGCD
jgi:tRNA dimethylallyltransferase